MVGAESIYAQRTREAFSAMDVNRDGWVTAYEYATAMGAGARSFDEAWFSRCFAVVDADRNGRADAGEFRNHPKEVAGQLPLVIQARNEYEAADVLTDGVISWREFSNWHSIMNREVTEQSLIPLFTAIDANRDYAISPREYARAGGSFSPRAQGGRPAPEEDFFAAADTNQDGIVSRREYERWRGWKSLEAAPYEGRSAFHGCDADRDGGISRKEYQIKLEWFRGNVPAVPKAWAECDRDGDGFVEPDEYERWRGWGGPLRRTPYEGRHTFRACDADRNGVISLAEFEARQEWFTRGAPLPPEPFVQCDSDGDGWISAREYAAFRSGIDAPFRDTCHQACDNDRDGRISLDEYVRNEPRFCATPAPVDRFAGDVAFRAPWRQVLTMNDGNGDGDVTWKEYQAANRGRDLGAALLEHRFASIDADGNARLTAREFERYQRAAGGARR
jgi:Ca2+-binding EF-hand superfamily protein